MLRIEPEIALENPSAIAAIHQGREPRGLIQTLNHTTRVCISAARIPPASHRNMSSDPRVPKSRQPKAYTDEQLAFLRGLAPIPGAWLSRVSYGSGAYSYWGVVEGGIVAAVTIPRIVLKRACSKLGISVSFSRYLPEYEKRSQGSVRGDSKKFAFQKAAEYIATFGVSAEFVGAEDGEARFKEVGTPNLNTASSLPPATGMSWDPATGLAQYPGHGRPDGKTASSSSLGQAMSPLQPYSPTGLHMGPSSSLAGGSTQHATAASSSSVPHSAHPANTPLGTTPHVTPSLITQHTLREAFLTFDAPSLGSVVQRFAVQAQQHSHTPLTPVVEALFEASIAEAPAYSRDPAPLVRRYFEAATYLPSGSAANGGIMHAGVAGPSAAARALQMAVRRNSVWVGVEKMVLATSTSSGSPGLGTFSSNANWSAGQGYYHGATSPMPTSGSGTPGLASATASSSLNEDMQRIASERQRRKDHIQWARIHAAALELGMMGQQTHGAGRGSASSSSSITADGLTGAVDGTSQGSTQGYAAGRAFSEMVARDADGFAGDRRQREEYAEMLRNYESRWKEIKDEVRQTMVMEALITAKEDLARLEDSPMAQ
ncbi:hypothetical protein NMY22_g9277 [Coprinellus aureogranulatus]|nr:hypothetical protein NMY22_g9277 [Coprinellus aureogranulatus]